MNNNQNESKEKDKKSFTTGRGDAIRYNTDKLRYDLVEPHAMRDFVDVLTYGANKYFDRNWEKGFSWTSVLASLKRHIQAFEMGEDYDPESGKLHIAHAACNVHYLNAFYYIFPQGDDRPKRFLKILKIGLDVDGVIADWVGLWNKQFGTTNTPNSWYFDREVKKKIEEMKKSGTLNDFYLNIEPLVKPEEIPFEPHCYITSRPIPKEITEQWLDKHQFPCKQVYNVGLDESKVNIAKEAGIEIFIDDNYHNFVELNNNGVFTYLYSRPWNIRYDVGHMRINSLKDIPLLK